MKNPSSPHIPTPLKDWLDTVITDSTATKDSAEKRKAAIMNAILYPIKRTHTKTTGTTHTSTEKKL